MSSGNGTGRGFTGRHMAAVMIGFFGVVIVVNVQMARMAIGTFGGEVVENSYVASQHFNHWLDEAATEKQLGWSAKATRRADGKVLVRIAGAPGTATVSALARHPLGVVPDVPLRFVPAGDGSFVSATALPDARWRLRIDVQADGRRWRSEDDVL